MNPVNPALHRNLSNHSPFLEPKSSTRPLQRVPNKYNIYIPLPNNPTCLVSPSQLPNPTSYPPIQPIIHSLRIHIRRRNPTMQHPRLHKRSHKKLTRRFNIQMQPLLSAPFPEVEHVQDYCGGRWVCEWRDVEVLWEVWWRV
ncbi:hypothetical protein BCR33DRAFT_770584 [Rhizoclosmatium globosum]|uniref:Uncharacterized protein n=1 Tax=Rhizoclosmatium globosum TaxID=329046 RepID=A0A1Y2BMK7_9FUNG|nr:hypothetical protein BCR33DRAFT_770584 [Rhizoclosmatium globosum]|eukprot:ORY35989.1 hypothetical protein BCR33DRAFT_770584 [Rhizoclosmatium globosum]